MAAAAAAADADADLLSALGVTARGTAEVERDVIAAAYEAGAEATRGEEAEEEAEDEQGDAPRVSDTVVRPTAARAPLAAASARRGRLARGARVRASMRAV